MAPCHPPQKWVSHCDVMLREASSGVSGTSHGRAGTVSRRRRGERRPAPERTRASLGPAERCRESPREPGPAAIAKRLDIPLGSMYTLGEYEAHATRISST